MEGLVQLVLIEQVCRLIALLSRLSQLLLQVGDLEALPPDGLPQVEQLLRRALILALLHEVLQLAHALNETLGVEELSLVVRTV